MRPIFDLQAWDPASFRVGNLRAVPPVADVEERNDEPVPIGSVLQTLLARYGRTFGDEGPAYESFVLPTADPANGSIVRVYSFTA